MRPTRIRVLSQNELVVDEDSEQAARILVVDDEKVIRDILCEFLALEGYLVRSVEDGDAAMQELRMRPYDIVISDLKMPRVSGIALLEKITESNINVLTVIMTGFGTVETAIEAMKKGAYDYVLKPFKVEEVVRIIQRGLDRRRLKAENIRLKEALTLYRVSEAMATSLEIDQVLDVILRATLDESSGDVASLHLQDPKTAEYVERIKLTHEDSMPIPDGHMPSLEMTELQRHFATGKPILAHGIQANRFFSSTSNKHPLVSYVALPLQVAGRLIGMLNVFSFTPTLKFDEGARKMLSVLASRAASAIENARLYDDLLERNLELRHANVSLEDNYQKTVLGFAQALEESDRYTRGHSERVSGYAGLLAERVGMTENEVRTIVQAGLMHDIGKIGIRYDMLNKPGRLTTSEIQVFREHPNKGRRIMAPIPCMQTLIDAAWCHHEWFDGGGYPRNLSGQDIPIQGRIVSIADAYDAMTSDRAYRKALPHAVAVKELLRCSGTQFDPELAKAFVAVIEEFRKAAQEAGQFNLVPA
jgi:response regulator RpfG family c-di-GMP phosphodiesterase